MEKLRERYLREAVEKDLTNRIVFVGGPRQVGKTTFALSLLQAPSLFSVGVEPFRKQE